MALFDWFGPNGGTFSSPNYWLMNGDVPGHAPGVGDQAVIDNGIVLSSSDTVVQSLTLGGPYVYLGVGSSSLKTGSLYNDGELDLINNGQLLVANTLSLTGSGRVFLATSGSIGAIASGSTLDNIGNTILAYGTVGNSSMYPINGQNGVIAASYAGGSPALTVATGTHTIINNGQIEADGQRLNSASPIQNNGTISASAGGDVVITGAITGTGTLTIENGGTVEVVGSVASTAVVNFKGQGTLKIDDVSEFQGRINGIQLGDQIVISPSQKLIADAIISLSTLYLYETNSLNAHFASTSKIWELYTLLPKS